MFAIFKWKSVEESEKYRAENLNLSMPAYRLHGQYALGHRE